MTVTDAAVMPGVVVPGTDSIAVQPRRPVPRDDSNYRGSGVDRTAFSLRFDGSTYSPETFRNGLYRDGEWGRQCTETGGPLVFNLPETGSASDTQLSGPAGSGRHRRQFETVSESRFLEPNRLFAGSEEEYRAHSPTP